MTAPHAKHLDLDMDDLKKILERAAREPLSEEDRTKLWSALQTLAFMQNQLRVKGTSIQRLRKMIFGGRSEKTNKVFALLLQDAIKSESDSSAPSVQPSTDPAANVESSAASQGSTSAANEDAEAGTEDKKRKGHGRLPASKYPGATRCSISHESLKPGEKCPECGQGKLYRMPPTVLVRIWGQPPLGADLLEVEKLRCNLCGEIFEAGLPPNVGKEKYDVSAGFMIGLLKYGTGMPFNRLAHLQEGFGIPLPAGTQWELVHDRARALEPVYGELIHQAAQGEVMHNDDTTAKILALMASHHTDKSSSDSGETKNGTTDQGEAVEPERTGIFTSGIVVTHQGVRIALFFTGRKHAGENLTEVLSKRDAELGPPIQMCDGLSRNIPEEFKTILCNCIAHGRRKFVDVAAHFPEECRHVLETLGEVYHNDAIAKEQKMSPDERLAWHIAQSGPLMEDLEKWMKAQFDEKNVEPNSGLGEAIAYMQGHWDKMTRFLHVAGAPLDNNICERSLKKAILHRKNSYFFKTENGAHVADVFMTIIHTAELNKVNAFDYLVALHQHHDAVVANPADWMPWNYKTACGPPQPPPS
jgi:transposase